MANETLDIKIQKLFQIIQDKKSKLAKLDRFNPKTNCSYKRFSNETPVNLHVLSIEDLLQVLGWLMQDAYWFTNACKEAELEKTFKHLGFSFTDWKSDIITLIEKKNIDVEKRDLADKEAKLNQLISPEEKRRLEIEALEKELE